MCHWPFQGGIPIFPLINVWLFQCIFCVFVAIYIHVVFLSWFCAVRMAACCVCCVTCMNSSLSFSVGLQWCFYKYWRFFVQNVLYVLGYICALCKIMPHRKYVKLYTRSYMQNYMNNYCKIIFSFKCVKYTCMVMLYYVQFNLLSSHI